MADPIKRVRVPAEPGIEDVFGIYEYDGWLRVVFYDYQGAGTLELPKSAVVELGLALIESTGDMAAMRLAHDRLVAMVEWYEDLPCWDY